MLNTTRSLPTRLALRYAALTSAGLLQSTLDASRNQARSGCSASACSGRSQNSFRALREIILMPLSYYYLVPWREQGAIRLIPNWDLASIACVRLQWARLQGARCDSTLPAANYSNR